MRLKGVICAASAACTICVFCASRKDATETPIELPTLRTRLNNDVPSVRSSDGRVAKATTWSGVKTRPRPAPCVSVVTVSDQGPMSGVQPTISRADSASRTKPTNIKMRGSMRLTSLPAASMAIIVPAPRGAINIPA
jgi:hypothetical protein